MNRCGAAVAVADVTALVALRSSVRTLLHHAGAPRDWLAAAGPDRALATVASAALWCTAAVVGAGLCCAAAAGMPGAVGRSAARAGEILLPRAVQRLLAGSAGLGVLLAPVAAGAALPRHVTAPAATVTAAGSPQADPLPAPAWPLDPPATPALPPPAWPAGSQDRSTGSLRAVTVQPGDSLWLIAARRLTADGRPAIPAQVALAWRRWYAANRGVVGADPALIRPGQVLQAPAAAHQEEPA